MRLVAGTVVVLVLIGALGLGAARLRGEAVDIRRSEPEPVARVDLDRAEDDEPPPIADAAAIRAVASTRLRQLLAAQRGEGRVHEFRLERGRGQRVAVVALVRDGEREYPVVIAVEPAQDGWRVVEVSP
ncbi:MAG: hypothetical protein R3C15_02535 [Thermoleophilia bacterium]